MSENDNNIRQELLDSFQGKSAQELSELLADLTLNYVVRQRRPAIDQLAMMPVPDDLRDLTFGELIGVLQAQLGMSELECFSVANGVVTVRWGEQQLTMSDDADQPAASKGGGRAASSPSKPAPAAPKAASPKAAPAQAKNPAPQASDASDRFSMLEMD